MPDSSLGGIFLSYRREDTTPYARLLKTELNERIPDAHVFMDLDSIKAGRDFAEVIRDAIDSSTVLVALIGRQWTTLTDEEGHRRLDNLDDWVRFEIHAALERDVQVIPVLVNGAKPPRQQQLPSELHKLARLSAFEVSDTRYQYDAGRLVDLIQEVLAEASGSSAVHQSPSAADADAPTVALPASVRPDRTAVPREAAQKDAEPARGDRAQAIRVLADAERIVQSVVSKGTKALLLADVGKALVAIDPDRSGQLNADAEDTARSITDEDEQLGMLADLATTLAATDPDHAERVIRSITTGNSWVEDRKARALATLAVSLAVVEPDRAARLNADAEDIAKSITDKSHMSWAFTDIVRILATADLDRAAWLIGDAERLTEFITLQGFKARALSYIATALAAIEPDRAAWLIRSAEDIAQSITDESTKAWALADVAKALVAINPEDAVRLVADMENLAQTIVDESAKALALASFVGALTAVDTDRAQGLAELITDPDMLAELVKKLGATDPGRAEHLARSTSIYGAKELALAALAAVLAATNPDRAEYIARSIIDDFFRVRALVAIAEIGLSLVCVLTEAWNGYEPLAVVSAALRPSNGSDTVIQSGFRLRGRVLNHGVIGSVLQYCRCHSGKRISVVLSHVDLLG